MELLLAQARLIYGEQDWSAWSWEAKEYGTAWADVSSGTSFLTGVWGSGANDVWAVGSGGTILERPP
jgi:hypothetical protein